MQKRKFSATRIRPAQIIACPQRRCLCAPLAVFFSRMYWVAMSAKLTSVISLSATGEPDTNCRRRVGGNVHADGREAPTQPAGLRAPKHLTSHLQLVRESPSFVARGVRRVRHKREVYVLRHVLWEIT